MSTVDWSRFRDNDKVRITYDGVWRNDRLWIGEKQDVALGVGMMTGVDSAELIGAPITGDPGERIPTGTVVLDSGGYAWQFDGTYWILAALGSPGGRRHTREFVEAFGPLRVLVIGDGTDE